MKTSKRYWYVRMFVERVSLVPLVLNHSVTSYRTWIAINLCLLPLQSENRHGNLPLILQCWHILVETNKDRFWEEKMFQCNFQDEDVLLNLWNKLIFIPRKWIPELESINSLFWKDKQLHKIHLCSKILKIDSSENTNVAFLLHSLFTQTSRYWTSELVSQNNM